MFNLDLIEQDWKKNSFHLSEEEIIEIYRRERITLSKYKEELDTYMKKNSYSLNLSVEERLLRAIFGEDLKAKEKNNLKSEISEPQKKHLSKESQKKVIEGCLHIVFDATREWYNFFEGKLSMETIYYICLESIMNSVKYVMHCEKPVFRFYVLKSIEKNIIKYVARYIHITYQEVYELTHYSHEYGIDHSLKKLDKNLKSLFDRIEKEEPEKPSKIYYRLKNDYYNTNYIKNISSNEFMIDYNMALEKLDDIAKMVMQLSFDANGYRGLSNREIADYLGIDVKKISTIRRRAMKVLRKDKKLRTYL